MVCRFGINLASLPSKHPRIDAVVSQKTWNRNSISSGSRIICEQHTIHPTIDTAQISNDARFFPAHTPTYCRCGIPVGPAERIQTLDAPRPGRSRASNLRDRVRRWDTEALYLLAHAMELRTTRVSPAQSGIRVVGRPPTDLESERSNLYSQSLHEYPLQRGLICH